MYIITNCNIQVLIHDRLDIAYLQNLKKARIPAENGPAFFAPATPTVLGRGNVTARLLLAS